MQLFFEKITQFKVVCVNGPCYFMFSLRWIVQGIKAHVYHSVYIIFPIHNHRDSQSVSLTELHQDLSVLILI